jgi:hypothetical protein
MRTALCLAFLGGLAACGTSTPPVDQHVEATQYKQHARGGYAPPGPPDDPWGPYITESSAKFDVPERWIREVMRVESGGREYLNGDLITSPVGAMGLMQVMPSTFDEIRARHDGIGGDPYDPHNNILAGAAYIREMYDVYGSPGFLAAYNAGPRRLDDYLAGSKGLPDETRRYVAMIGPYITDSYPQHRSEADLMALNQIPIYIPAGTRYHDAPVQVAQAPSRSRAATRTVLARNERGHERKEATIRLARAESRGAPSARGNDAMPTPPVEVAEYAPPRSHSTGGFHIVTAAMAEPMPGRHGTMVKPTLVSARAVVTETHAKAQPAHAKAEKASAPAPSCHKPAHHGAC